MPKSTETRALINAQDGDSSLYVGYKRGDTDRYNTTVKWLTDNFGTQVASSYIEDMEGEEWMLP